MYVEGTAVATLSLILGVFLLIYFPVNEVFPLDFGSSGQDAIYQMLQESLRCGILANFARKLIYCDRPLLRTFARCASVYKPFRRFWRYSPSTTSRLHSAVGSWGGCLYYPRAWPSKYAGQPYL